ncbi:MAG: rubredoxin [Planctomycetota bacterium]|nr:rubredoxin [Planctomycetota bacterium]
MQKMVCNICGWVYDPAVGDPANGVNPGTPFDKAPADFVCPECGAGREAFSPV